MEYKICTMQNNQAIFETLFNRNFSDTDNTLFLKEFTAQHPYFSPAQFFLLQNIKEDAVGYDRQAVKTNILFNNPHWLNFQLQQTNKPAQQNIALSQGETTEPAAKVFEPVLEIPEVVLAIPESVTQTYEPVLEAPQTVLKRTELATEKQEHVLETLGYALKADDNLPDDTDASGNMEKEIEPMSITLKMPEAKENLSEAMLFEPMHLVDYFASQGIKLSENILPGDKLGKQLKSFTEWLKIMKKVHVPDGDETAVKADSSVQVLAENSNADTGVLTESMAEVLIKQGKLAKAGEVYQKLSLLNPAKSTYFAAKIETLKAL